MVEARVAHEILGVTHDLSEISVGRTISTYSHISDEVRDLREQLEPKGDDADLSIADLALEGEVSVTTRAGLNMKEPGTLLEITAIEPESCVITATVLEVGDQDLERGHSLRFVPTSCNTWACEEKSIELGVDGNSVYLCPHF